MEAYQELEREFERWSGCRNVVACASGSAALHLGLEALQLPLGSKVLCPDLNMIAVPRAVTLAGHTPVFVDCNDRLLLDTDLLHVYGTCGAKAIMPVHIYGRRANMDVIADQAKLHGLAVVEDLAEAHGVKPHPETDAACYSFFQNKIIFGAEGGAVAFKDPARAALARQLRCLGFTPEHDFTHLPRGHNYRMSNVHAGLILDSLRNVEANLAKRREIEAWYDAECPPEWRMPPREVCWVYDLKIPGMTHEVQTAVVRALQAVGVAARHSFRPMSQQEEYRTCRTIGSGNAARLSAHVCYLPVQPDVTSRMSCWLAFETIRGVVG